MSQIGPRAPRSKQRQSLNGLSSGVSRNVKEGMKRNVTMFVGGVQQMCVTGWIPVSANADAAAHAFAGGGEALFPPRMAATHRGTQGRPRCRFGLCNVDPGRPHIERQRYAREYFKYRGYPPVCIINDVSQLSNDCTIRESAEGVDWGWRAVPKRVPGTAQKSCFGSLKCGS